MDEIQILQNLKAAATRGTFLLALATQHFVLMFAGIVKPECCTCRQGQVLQQNRQDNVAEY